MAEVLATTIFATPAWAITVLATTVEDGTTFGKKVHPPPSGHFEGTWKWRSHGNSE
jgi:hypothetical protein